MNNRPLITTNLVDSFISKDLTLIELSQPLNFEEFNMYLTRINNKVVFDSDLSNQLFEKMIKLEATETPSMRVFSEVYLQALSSLDKKIDIQEEHLSNLQEKLVSVGRTITDLRKINNDNQMPYKKQVGLLFTIQILTFIPISYLNYCLSFIIMKYKF